MTHSPHAARTLDGQRTWVLAGLALAAYLATAALAFAADEPVSAPSLAPVDESLIPNLPELPVLWQEPAAPLELLPALPFGPEDKGGTYVDMGRGQPSRLTEREKALLELSRAAVEASRAAGTLESPVVEVIATPVSPAEAERMKLEAIANAPTAVPVPGTGDPSDHTTSVVAGDPAGRSASGEVELTPSELAKVAAAQGRPGVVVLAPPVAPETEKPGAPHPPETNTGAAKTTEPSAKGK